MILKHSIESTSPNSNWYLEQGSIVKLRNHDKHVGQLSKNSSRSQKDEAKFAQEDEDDQVLLIVTTNEDHQRENQWYLKTK
jgi:hypothetical protein